MKRTVLLFTLMLSSLISYSQSRTEWVLTGDNVNVRTGPGTNYSVMQRNGSKVQLFKGDRVIDLGEVRSGFVKVKPVNGSWPQSSGWVASRYLRRATNDTHLSLTTLEKKIVGLHMLSLQWIEEPIYGQCKISKEPDGRLRCVGEHISTNHPGDYMKLNGYIEIVDADHLIFEGDIAIKVYHLNGGKEYVRTGRYDFITKPGRKYWRARNLEIIDATDYFDIYFKGI